MTDAATPDEALVALREWAASLRETAINHLTVDQLFSMAEAARDHIPALLARCEILAAEVARLRRGETGEGHDGGGGDDQPAG